MADGRPQGVSDDEWKALLEYRKASQPKRPGTMRHTDPETGAEFEIGLTDEEANTIFSKVTSKLLGGGKDSDKGGDDKDSKKPAQLRDFFPPGKKAAGS